MPRSAEVLPGRHPDIEVLAAVAGRGMDEAGAGVVGDMVAGEEGNVEIVAGNDPASGWVQVNAASAPAATSKALILLNFARRSKLSSASLSATM